MRTNKYAIRFPEFGDVSTKSSISIFSEEAVAITEKTFLRLFNALDSLTGFVIQKNRTSELEKQLEAQKQALDVEIDNKIDQIKTQYEEESKRLHIRLEQEKDDMDIEFQKLKIETVERAKDFSFSYEEYMRANVRFRKIITQEKTFLEEIHGYIEMLEDNFSNRKEYILYCDAERKSLELINRYLELLI